MTSTVPRTAVMDRWNDQHSSRASQPALVAAYTEIAIALVAFIAAIVGDVLGPMPLMTLMACMAVLVTLQLAIVFTLRQRDEHLRRVGMLGAGALALIGMLATATLVVAIWLLVAAFLVDSALGVPPADLDQILAELGLAQYVRAQGIAVAIPIVGWLTLLNARSALSALDEPPGNMVGLGS